MTSTRTRSPIAALLLLLASLVLWPATQAGAQGATPTPCVGGMLATDPAGDEDVGPDGLGLTSLVGVPSPLNTRGTAPALDITGFFLNYENIGGKQVLTGNMQINDLPATGAVPSGSWEGAVHYWFQFDTVSGTRWVRAVTDGSAWSFDYGANERDLLIAHPSTPTETTGRIFAGKNGIIQIDFPALDGFGPGSAITGLQALSGMWAPTFEGETGFFLYSDLAPEDGVDYTVTACPAAAPAPAPAAAGGGPAAPRPGSSTGPASGGGSQPGTQPAPGGQGTAFTTLPFSAPKSLGSAKKASKKKSITFSAKAGTKITDLFVKVKKGSKILASQRVASFSGGKLKLKLLSKKVKKGKYTLTATGKVDGKTLTYVQAVKLGG